MDGRGRGSVRAKVGVLFALAGLLTGALAVVSPVASAEPLTSGTLGAFENEGDQVLGSAANIDWGTVKTDARITEWLLIHDDNDPDTDDATYIDSAKEQDPSTWGCAAAESPAKDDLFRLYLASQINAEKQFLHIGYVREKAQGDTDINIEFNQVTAQFSCPGDTGGRVRSRDDLMLSFTFGGGSDSSLINVFRWDPTAEADSPGDPAPSVTGSDLVAADGHWDLVALAPNVAVGSDNSHLGDDKDEPLITDEFFDQAELEPRTFGELTIDIGAAFPSGLACPGFGFVTGHSRASHSFASDLKDVFPEAQFDLSDCAKIRIKKVDDSTPPVPQQGAVYGLYDSLAKAQAVAGQSDDDAKAAAVDHCTTAADGTCVLDKADPDRDYWITEITPPAGLLPSTEIRAVTASQLEPFGTLDLTTTPFVNAVPVGNVTITKRLFDDANDNGVLDPGEQITPDDASDLDGISFTLEQSGVTAETHPDGDDATCTITGGTGQCSIASVKLGTYDIVEVLNPSGPSGIGLGASPSVTITTHGQTVQATYDNPLSPINIALDKIGDRDQANIGDTVNYTFTVTTTGVRLHDVTLQEWEGELLGVSYADICDTGPTFDATLSTGEDDGFLDVDDAFVWRCPHLVTGSDPDPLPNRARAAGTDDVGRSADAYDTFTVDVLHPNLSVVKEAADGVDADETDSASETVDAPGIASFTISVTNVGAGAARNVTLTDTLPDGSWTVTLTSPDADDECPAVEGPQSGSFTCTFGSLASGASKVVTVARAVTIADDCGSELLNNAGATTTYLDVDIESDSSDNDSSATVHVRCPDVAVEKTASSSPVEAGERAEWTVTVTNHGAGVAREVRLLDAVPLQLTGVEVGGPDADDCTVVDNTVSCAFGDIAASDGAPGGPDTRVITVSGLTEPSDCGTIPNTAMVVGAQDGVYDDTDASNNSDTASLAVRCPVSIDLVKTGSVLAHVGDLVSYSFTATNSGGVDLTDIVLSDPKCNEGSIVLVDDADGDSVLAAGTFNVETKTFEGGEVWRFECQRTVVASDVVRIDGDAFILNTGTVRGEDVDGREATSSDDHRVQVISPAIQIVKTVDDPTPAVGDTVTFTYVVTNIGDTTLFDITVVDDQLGDIGTISELAVGASATLTDTMDVATNSPVRNVGTATGSDSLGKVVTDDDDATIAIVLGIVLTAPELPRTGGETRPLLIASAVLLVLGGALIALGERATSARLGRRHP